MITRKQGLPRLVGKLSLASRTAKLESSDVASAYGRGLLLYPSKDVGLLVLLKGGSRNGPPTEDSSSVGEPFQRQPQESLLHVGEAVEREGVSQFDKAYGQVAGLWTTQHRHADYAGRVVAVAKGFSTQGGDLGWFEHCLSQFI